MIRLLRGVVAAFALFLAAPTVRAQTFTQVQWGINRGSTPSPICVMNGTSCLGQIGTLNVGTGAVVFTGAGLSLAGVPAFGAPVVNVITTDTALVAQPNFNIANVFQHTRNAGGTGNRETVGVILNGSDAGTSEFMAAGQATAHATAGAGLYFGWNAYCQIDATVATTAQCSGQESNTDIRNASVVAKTGMQIVDVNTSTGLGTVIDAGLYITSQANGRGYGNAIQVGFNGTDQTGVANGGSILVAAGGNVTNGIDLSRLNISGSVISSKGFTASGSGKIDLGVQTGGVNGNALLFFHSNGRSDVDAQITSSGGNAGSNNGGVLAFAASQFQFNSGPVISPVGQYIAANKFLSFGSTSGQISILPQAIAGTYNFNLPTSAGASGQPLLSGGGGSAAMTFGPLALANLATQSTNTIVGNATFGSAAPTELAIGSCSTSASALTWTTNSGFGCNTAIVPTFANPTASVGLSAVNGSATTAMRSDAAPALSQAIAPTWSGIHTFSLAPVFSTGVKYSGATSGNVTVTASAVAGTPTITWGNTSGTPAVTASGPLAINTTTGNATCTTCVTSSGGGAITASAPVTASAAGNIAITGAAGQVLAGATPAFTATPTLGVAGATLGTLALAGNTSGTVTITPQATAGSPTLTLPNATGTFAVGASGPLALSATTGNLTCSTCATTTNGGALSGTSPVALSAAGAISITGAAGQVLAGSGPAFTNAPTLGVPGSSVGSIAFANATSGTVTVQPVTGALGSVTLSLPAATDTLMGRATTDTVTNKDLTSTTNTFPADGVANTYTPTMTWLGTAPTAFTASGRWKKLASKLYYFYATVSITTLGAGAGVFEFSLPNSSTVQGTIPCFAINQSTSVNVTGSYVSGGVAVFNPGTMAAQIYDIGCVYEST